MTKQEFTERTNIQLTDEQYSQVEAIYMNAGEMDKDTFCKDYKKHQGSEIMSALADRCDGLAASNDLLNRKIKHLTNVIIDQAHKYSSPELRETAIELVGIKRYLEIKLRKGQCLWDKDKDELLYILSK